MGYTDPDRDARIAELSRALREVDERYHVLHDMWRAGLREAERVKAWSVVNALNGNDDDGQAPAGQEDPGPRPPRCPARQSHHRRERTPAGAV